MGVYWRPYWKRGGCFPPSDDRRHWLMPLIGKENMFALNSSAAGISHGAVRLHRLGMTLGALKKKEDVLHVLNVPPMHSTKEPCEDSIVFLVNHITGGWYWETAAPGVTWSDFCRLEPLQFLSSGSLWSWFPVQWLHLLSSRWYFTRRSNRSKQQTHAFGTWSKQWAASVFIVSVMKYCQLTVIPD